jgi:rhodanese-related sulfurtransferase
VTLPTIPGIDVGEAERRRRAPAAEGQPAPLLVDVREVSEFNEVRAEDVVLLPMSTLPARLAELPQDRELLFICRSGARSGQVTAYLRAQGRENVWNVNGGMLAWEAASLPVRRGVPSPDEGHFRDP